MPFQLGREKTGGRKPGVCNRTTLELKEAIEMAYNGIGGLEAFTRWAKRRRDLFYAQILPKILPRDIIISGPGLPDLLYAMAEIARMKLGQVEGGVPLLDIEKPDIKLSKLPFVE
jgi:hypothetical protein